MIIEHAGRNCLARHTRLAGARLFAGAVAMLLMSALSARAEELVLAKTPEVPADPTWVCTDYKDVSQPGRAPLELMQKDGLLIGQPYGTPRYQVLADTAYALIGVDHGAEFEPVLGTPSVFVTTVMIDKTSGNFAIAMTFEDRVSEHHAGYCRRFETRPTGAAETTVAQRK